MIKRQVIKEGEKPIAIILDYQEYLHLKEMAEDWEDYQSAMKTGIGFIARLHKEMPNNFTELSEDRFISDIDGLDEFVINCSFIC